MMAGSGTRAGGGRKAGGTLNRPVSEQTDRQLERSAKTTYKAGERVVNSLGSYESRVPFHTAQAKKDRMLTRIHARINSVSAEQRRRLERRLTGQYSLPL